MDNQSERKIIEWYHPPTSSFYTPIYEDDDRIRYKIRIKDTETDRNWIVLRKTGVYLTDENRAWIFATEGQWRDNPMVSEYLKDRKFEVIRVEI